MRNRVLRSIGAVVLLSGVLVAGMFAQPASAKSYTFPSLRTQAVINADGSMNVVEHITYTFDGEFHNGLRPINPGNYEIVDMRVTENGAALPFDGAPYNLSWHFTASNETRTFDVSYRVLRAVKVGTDVGDLVWNWTGTQHPEIGTVDVTLTAPTGDQLRAWAHGPLSGTTQTTANVVTQHVSPLPQGQFMESRLAIPTTALTAKPTAGVLLPDILSYEQGQADNANTIRTEATQETPTYPTALFNVLAGLGALVAIGFHVLIWRKWGKEPARPADVGNYWYEPPDVAPATVVKTLGSGDAFASTVVDLAQRGYFTIEEIKDDSGLLGKLFGGGKDWRFTKQKDPGPDMKPFEICLYRYLFRGDATSVRQSDLKDFAKDRPTEARNFFSTFESEVKDSVDGVYWASGTGLAKGLNVTLAIGLGVLGLVSIGNHAGLGALDFLVAVALLVLTRNMSRRTELGARKAAEWNGLKNYLQDYTHFKDAPIGQLVLWERYLVYGVAFGIAAQLVKNFEMRAPDLQNNSSFAPWYIGSSGSSGLMQLAALSTFTNGLQSSMTPPSNNSNFSSGSGFGGGGFSSGGGFGGGGGGFGAN